MANADAGQRRCLARPPPLVIEQGPLMRKILLFAADMVLAHVPELLSAQSWRTFDAARPQRDAGPLAVHLTYGAGRVRVSPGSDRSLYDVHMRYDAERADPMYHYDAAERSLQIGTKRVSGTKSIKNDVS